MSEIARPPFWPILKRGMACTCPACGQGKLFTSYLKQVDACPACQEPLGHIRADDGPAWLTIIVVGHLLAPFFPLLKYAADWPLWVWAALLPTVVLGLTLALLPIAKGVFIAILWRTKAHHTQQ
jgi:uncharacterized protein (DUF983 family)